MVPLFLRLRCIKMMCVLIVVPTTSAFILYETNQLIYYDETVSGDKMYNETVSSCHALAGHLPRSIDELKKYPFHSELYQTNQFWLGPIKLTTDQYFKWPDGSKYIGDGENWRRAQVNCMIHCCALTAISVLNEAVRVKVKEIVKCSSKQRQLCVISDPPRVMVDRIHRHDHQLEVNSASVQRIQGEVNKLIQLKEQLTLSTTKLLDKMKVHQEQLQQLTSSPTAISTSVTNSIECWSHQLHSNDPFLIQSEDGTFYYFNRTRGSLDQAIKLCDKIHGALPSIHSEEESNLLTSLIGFHSSLWLGASKDKLSETFYWMDGSSFDYEPWTQLSPQCTGECCSLQLSSYKTSYSRMFQSDCSNESYIICRMSSNLTDQVKDKFRLNLLERQVTFLRETVKQQSNFITNVTASLYGFFYNLQTMLDIEG